jgi:TatD DNase family protein
MPKSNAISFSGSLGPQNGLNLVDTHSHLFWDSYKEDFDAVIKRAVDAGVTTAINVGVGVEISRIAASLETNNPRMKFYSSIGIHPHDAYLYTDDQKLADDIGALEKIYSENPEKVIGVGECGLDNLFNPHYAPNGETMEQLMKLQRKLLSTQIDLAKKLNLPILIHCRDDRSKNPENTQCWDEVVELTKDWKGIYHCYSGLASTTNSILHTTNFLFSFAGNITYPKNDYLKEAIKIIPLERIVLETDCPFLPPQSIRGKRNEPSSVKEIAQTIADIKGVSLEAVAKTTTDNFRKQFGL